MSGEAPRSGGDQPRRQPQTQPRGQLLEQISNSIVGLYREGFGRGPTAAKTYVLDDLVICVLRDGLTQVERTLRDRGDADFVRDMRLRFQSAVETELRAAVEEATGRKVIAFLSQATVDPELMIEVFFIDGDLVGNGSHEASFQDPAENEELSP